MEYSRSEIDKKREARLAFVKQRPVPRPDPADKVAPERRAAPTPKRAAYEERLGRVITTRRAVDGDTDVVLEGVLLVEKLDSMAVARAVKRGENNIRKYKGSIEFSVGSRVSTLPNEHFSFKNGFQFEKQLSGEVTLVADGFRLTFRRQNPGGHAPGIWELTNRSTPPSQNGTRVYRGRVPKRAPYSG